MTRGIYAVVKDGKELGRASMPDSLAKRLPHLVRIEDAPPKTVPPPPLWRRAASYIAAEASKLMRGPAEVAMQEQRLAACRSCEHRQQVNGGEYCGKCGCGYRKRAELTIKATMPAAKCPLGRWDK